MIHTVYGEIDHGAIWCSWVDGSECFCHVPSVRHGLQSDVVDGRSIGLQALVDERAARFVRVKLGVRAEGMTLSSFKRGSGGVAHLWRGDRIMAGVRGEKLLTASDLATLCEVDLKTIHNWVDRGRITHFRTPGRHLRFRAADVADFLRVWGYSVPRELARASARTGLVVGSGDTISHVNQALGDAMPLKDVKHPYDALIMAGADPPDVYLVDAQSTAANVSLDHWLEALNRACPDARIVVLTDDAAQVPPFATHIGRSDMESLKSMLLPDAPAPGVLLATGTEMTTPATSNTSQPEEGLARAVGS